MLVLTLDDTNRYAFRPDRIMLISNIRLFGKYDSQSLESWRMERDLDEWDRRYPDRLPRMRYNI